MTHDFSDAVKVAGAEASLEEKQLYKVQIAVKSLIDFVVISFEQLGIEKLHELVDPSLDELHDIILQLDVKAKELDALDLQQILLTAQILIRDIKQKNPEMCALGSRTLKRATVFK
ncbi:MULTISPECIES: hypothetical protein [Enterobacteriaceae]|uniref:hypothetical protein n=1 Tax=Enterobacteriaceae TaxID=543 RepID=UPI00081A8C75|nr:MULTISPECIES: hypothetical protein [Enterobacteriaceae]MBJ4953317.1 hypothetical protein [Salmonella enterica subsp. enterica serovar Goldcoast]ANZ87768.1 hypothetical protein CfB38_2852 [Citrobacter freundii]ANZ87839.1 hypothetical protein CfB38_2924 [Citrobacter freundii]MBW7622125.1 hypothetical protein [Citrobacter portucalensis]MBW7639786.1 hypothetical protein [Citrobacter portucalensis]